MWKGMKVILTPDARICTEPEYLWDRYVEPKFRDRVPKVAFMDGVFMVYEPDGKDHSQRRSPVAAAGERLGGAEENVWREAYRQWWSAEIRPKDMDLIRLGYSSPAARPATMRQLCLPGGS